MIVLKKPQAENRFLLPGVSWDFYQRVLEEIGEGPIRVTYDRGSLEFMSPSPIHEIYSGCLGNLIQIAAEEFEQPLKCLGSTTYQREDLDRGLEPDRCYYITSIDQVQDWENLDLNRDPPPDLAVEVEISRSALERMGVYAALTVPEVWRFNGDTLRIFRLIDGEYQLQERSAFFPALPLSEVVPLVQQSVQCKDDIELLRALRSWIRQYLTKT